MKKVKERTPRYEISIKEREDGYVARISFKLGNEKNPRVESFGTTTDLSVLNLLYKLDEKLEDSFQKGLIEDKISNIVIQKLYKSINVLGIRADEITECLNNISNRIVFINSKITGTGGIIPFYNIPNIQTNILMQESTEKNNNISETKMILFEAFVKEWFKYKLSLCKETPDNPRPLSQATVDGYHRPLFKQIIPYMKKNKIVYLQQITKELIEDLLKQLNGYDNKRIVYIVFSMLYQYAIKNKDYKEENIILKIDKPKKPPKKGKKKKVIVKRADEEKWLDLLEKEYDKEQRDCFLILYGLLLEGTRPEEMTSISWEDVDFEADTIRLKDAYKSFSVYDDDCNIIGTDKRLDKLKTDTSYRTITLHPRFKKVLLKHKEEQKERFKNSIKMKKKKKYWSEKEFVFLSRTFRPYLSTSLAKPLRQFRKNHNLGDVVPYALRTSFATNSAERGVDRIALQTALGHSDYKTSDQYYIQPTEEFLKEEFNNKVYANA